MDTYKLKAEATKNKVIAQVGNSSRLARAMNAKGVRISRQAIDYWNRIPLKHCVTVADITGISVAEMLPEAQYQPPSQN